MMVDFTSNFKPREWLQKAAKRTAVFFSGLALKYKLSINIAIIVVMVIAIFSLLILPIQQRVLDNSTHETCTVLLKSLSNRVKEPLLLSNLDQVKNADIYLEVMRTMKMGVRGMEYIQVFNQDGKTVVASDSSKAGGFIPSHKLTALTENEQVTILENDAFREYYFSIKYKEPTSRNKVAIGIACIGFSKDILEQPIAGTKRRIWALAALVIIISVWVIYFSAQKMVNQIHALSHAAREVGRGNLDVHVTPRNRDELGQLAHDFNNMVIHLREKLQMQKFLSKLTVQMIHQKGGVKVEPYESERRNVTILFSDIRNFSAIAEDSEPEQIVRLINIYFDLQTTIIESNGGVVDKFMGDQIMAVFQGPKMVRNSVNAAIEIQRAVRELNQRREIAGEVTFELGIGINNGLAVLGNMGSKSRMDYSVVGDVVNIASRLCSIARSGQIIIEQNLARSLNGEFVSVRLDSILVKGRTKPVEISEIEYDLEMAA